MPRKSDTNPDDLILFDSHCHLTDSLYADDLPTVLKRAHQAGVKTLMTVSLSVPNSRENIALASTESDLYCAVGIHPHEADSFRPHDLQSLKNLCIESSVKAIGETGLDFFRGYSSKANQETAFRAQIEMARMLDLPMIIHVREAAPRARQILEEHGYFYGVLHCFSGDRRFADWAVEKGLYISFAGNLTHDVALPEVARGVPHERLMVETDSPYQVPVPERGRVKRCEPAFLRHTVSFLAQTLDRPVSEVAKMTFENGCRCFRISQDNTSPG
uniref:TatD family deoxyribonuclease n=1 Tax=candidate division WOR-3 bacterium TaxID=2052148 RepID=A0A7C4CD14_UNCW3